VRTAYYKSAIMDQQKNIFLLSLLAIGFLSLAWADKGDDDRIVGGKEVKPNSVPWQVALAFGDATIPFCGGTITSGTKIVTAAHCVVAALNAKNLKVIVGEHDTLDHTDNATIHDVKNMVVHPKYDLRTLENDLAVLTLAVPIDLSDVAKPACLPTRTSRREFKAGLEFVVSGWGKLKFNGDQPNVLHSVPVPHVTHKECKKAYNGSLHGNMMCAGNVEEGGIDSCQGDSGGPLTKHYPKLDRTKLVGVVSWGVGCGLKGNPGVYTRVDKYVSWLKSVGVKNTCAKPTRMTSKTN